MLYPPLKGHRDTISDLAFSPDEKKLASSSVDGTVHLWDAETGELISTLDHGSAINGVAISKDGLLASAGADGFVSLWDLGSSDRVGVLSQSEKVGQVQRVAFHPDGKLLASGGEDGRIV